VSPYYHLEWKVKYTPGKLVAQGMRDGKSIEAVVEITCAPAAIRLTTDRTTLSANNTDLAVVNVAILDAQGCIVPVADNEITFKLSGPAKLIGVGNGDPNSHEPDKASHCAAFNRLAQAFVQTTMKDGKIALQAEAAGLKTGSRPLQSDYHLAETVFAGN
jgi:beta-galactosidase